MEIYLDHPHHGAMVAYSEAEIAEYLKRGWKRRPADWVQPKILAAREEAARKAQEAKDAERPARGSK